MRRVLSAESPAETPIPAWRWSHNDPRPGSGASGVGLLTSGPSTITRRPRRRVGRAAAPAGPRLQWRPRWGTGVVVTRRSPKPQLEVRFLGPPLGPPGA